MLRHPDLKILLKFKEYRIHSLKVCDVLLRIAPSTVGAWLSSCVSFYAESFKNSAALNAQRIPGCGGRFWSLLFWSPASGLDAPL